MKGDKSMKIKNSAIPLILIVLGIIFPVHNNHLAYRSLDEGEYVNRYVKGDAYNYIVAGGITGGKIAGTMSMKGMFIVGGAICFALGLSFALSKNVLLSV